MEEVNDAAADDSQSQSSQARNMDPATTAEQSDNPDEIEEGMTSVANNKGKEIAVMGTHGGGRLQISISTSDTNAMLSQGSDSPVGKNPTASRNTQTTRSQSGEPYEGGSLALSMLSLIETGVEKNETSARNENEAQDVQNRITQNSMPNLSTQISVPVQIPLPTQSPVSNQLTDAEVDDMESAMPTVATDSFLTSFTWFPNLPGELRVKIWKLMLPGQRYVEIKSTVVLREESDDWHAAPFPSQEYNVKTWHAVGIDEAPVGFFVCQESRTEVLKIYTPLKSTDGFPALLVDFKKDILCFRYWQNFISISAFLDSLPNDTLERSLANILVDELEGFGHYLQRINRKIGRFQGLKELLLAPFCTVDASEFQIIGFSVRENHGATPQELEIDKIFGGIKKENPEWQLPEVICGTLLTNQVAGHV